MCFGIITLIAKWTHTSVGPNRSEKMHLKAAVVVQVRGAGVLNDGGGGRLEIIETIQNLAPLFHISDENKYKLICT